MVLSFLLPKQNHIQLILFENQIQTTSASPCRTQVQPAASFLVCSLIFIEYKFLSDALKRVLFICTYLKMQKFQCIILSDRAGKEVSDMVKFFTNRLELAQTSSMLFVESTYFFFAFCWTQEEIHESMQLSSITMPSFSIRSLYARLQIQMYILLEVHIFLFLLPKIERNRPCSVYLALSKVFLWNSSGRFTIFLSSGIILTILMN